MQSKWKRKTAEVSIPAEEMCSMQWPQTVKYIFFIFIQERKVQGKNNGVGIC